MSVKLRDFRHAAANAFFEFGAQAGIDRRFEARAHCGDGGRVPDDVIDVAIAVDGVEFDATAGERGKIKFLSTLISDAVMLRGFTGGELPVLDCLRAR